MVKIHSAGWSPEIGKPTTQKPNGLPSRLFFRTCLSFGQVELWIDFTLFDP